MSKLTATLFSTLKSHKLHHLPPLTTLHPPNHSHFSRLFSRTTNQPTRDTKLNFSPSDSDSDSDSPPPPSHKPNPPPPYNPFNKTPEPPPPPPDPTNLQQVFHNLRSDGLHNSAVKMFDALSKDGLTHEALELFSQIKDKGGQMPDVVAHTAVIEAYADAGKAKEALKVYMRMLASGVLPNAYTYSVLIKVLAGSDDDKLVGEGCKYFLEMMGKNIRPNPGTCLAIFEGLVKGGKEEEGRELVAKMKALGFAPDKESLRELLKNKRGQVYRSVMNILFTD